MAPMVTRVATVAFEGIEARAVDVQVQVTPGGVNFILVGPKPDKCGGREQGTGPLGADRLGLVLPAKRITVNLAPADPPKEGSHDSPIALGVMAAIGAIPADALAGYTVLGIGARRLDQRSGGRCCRRRSPLMAAAGADLPACLWSEAAAWAAADIDILAPRSLIQLATTSRVTQVMARPEPAVARQAGPLPDLADIMGQESAKRVLEIVAAGGHNLSNASDAPLS